MSKIKQMRDELLDIISQAQHQLSKVQLQCTHSNGTYEYRSYTDYDSSEYWRENKCTDCNRRWDEDSVLRDGTSNPKYTNNPEGNWREE